MFAEGSAENGKRDVLTVSGKRDEVLLPVWRALRRFESFNVQEPHWPCMDYSVLKRIGKELHGRAE